MTNLFNKFLLNKEVNKKGWIIKGVETDPKQKETDKDITIKDAEIKLIVSKEKGINDIMATIQVKGQEYSFLLNDEIVKYINKLKNIKEV